MLFSERMVTFFILLFLRVYVKIFFLVELILRFGNLSRQSKLNLLLLPVSVCSFSLLPLASPSLSLLFYHPSLSSLLTFPSFKNKLDPRCTKNFIIFCCLKYSCTKSTYIKYGSHVGARLRLEN